MIHRLQTNVVTEKSTQQLLNADKQHFAAEMLRRPHLELSKASNPRIIALLLLKPTKVRKFAQREINAGMQHFSVEMHINVSRIVKICVSV